jgi:hypothetical protein
VWGAHLQDAVRFLVFPLLVTTGLAMWQAPRIRRALKTTPCGGDTNPQSRSLPAER